MFRILIAATVAVAGASLSHKEPTSAAIAPHEVARAAPVVSEAAASTFQVVVLERQNCSACAEVRRQIVLPYNLRNDAPASLRIVDYDALGTGGHALSKPVVQLPTIVLFVDGVEQGRLSDPISAAQFRTLLANLPSAS